MQEKHHSANDEWTTPSSPEQVANWFSKAIFHWTFDLLKRGFRRPLEPQDIPKIHSRYEARGITADVQAAFHRGHSAGQKNPLWCALYAAFKREFWLGGLCRGTADCLLVLVPFVSRYLIQFVIDSYIAHLRGKAGPPVAHGIGYLVAMVIMLAIQSFAHNHYMYLMAVMGGRTRAIMVSAIFEKSANIRGLANSDPAAEKQKTKIVSDDRYNLSGNVINLVTVHCGRIDKTISAIHMLWTAPLSLGLAIALMVYNLRESALAGLGLLLFGFAGLIFVVKTLFDRRKHIDNISRERVSLLQEALTGIRLFKLFAWESGMAARIDAIRKRETHSQYRYGALRNFAGAVSQALPVLTAMMTFITYALTNHGLSPAIVFSSTALFTSLRMPLIYLPLCAQACVDCWSSLLLVQKFLLTNESCAHPLDLELKAAVEVSNATFCWDHSDTLDSTLKSTESDSNRDDSHSSFVLRNVNLTLRRGELVAVVGSIGSGKTSLIAALTGDMEMASGKVTWGTSSAVCSQQPCILNASIRENITFGTDWDEQHYQRVVDAASLQHDFKLLPRGDVTIVGERGVMLSGGQKQRIALARAMYSRSSCVLLDDPLSAVDAHVGHSLLTEGICGFMSDRTRLLCTHDPKVMQKCDRVLWMSEGRVRKLDTFQTLVGYDQDFAAFVRGDQNDAVDAAVASTRDTNCPDDPLSHAENKVHAQQDTVEEEDRTTKAVSWNVYGALLSPKMSAILFALCIPFLLIGNGSLVITQLWLSWWSSDRYGLPRNTYIVIYIALAAAQLIFLYIFGFLLSVACAHSTHILFDKAVRRLLGAPIHFFDRTPLGRHINRLTSDVDKMDNALPETLRMYAISLTALIPIFTIQIIYYNWFGIAVAVLIAALLLLAIFYRATARETERLEAVFRSAVLSRIVEGLSGAPTLRAYSIHADFNLKLLSGLDRVNGASFATVAIQRWLSLRQDAMTILSLSVLGALIIFNRHSQHPAVSGVALSLMINALQVIQVVVREWAEVESAMNATERLHAYASTIPVEEDDSTPDPPATSTYKQPPKDWPTSGEIVLADVCMRYRPDLPDSLHHLNLRIRAGEHVAIVGRTGAGKSSIINALFRFNPLSSGRITIDGLDISQMPLKSLRQALAIVPQESDFFSGTVRSNLDPFEEYTEPELLQALHDAHLDKTVSLADAVQTGGSNLSVGQRQLLALARVMLRKSRILIFDEATSSLDTDTDELVQIAMRKSTREKTVLCIAHRLRTVLWYDRVCVMDEGKIVELASPAELWDDTEGYFRRMCDQAGIMRGMIESAGQSSIEVAEGVE